MRIRTRYIVYPRVQWTLIFVYLLSLFGFFGVTVFFTSYSFSEMMDLGRKSQLPENHVYYQFIAAQLKDLIKYLLLSLLCAMVVGTLFFVWFSHHLVGPIVGLIGYLKRAKLARETGEPLKPLRFRKGDFFHDLADGVNEVLQEKPREEVESKKSQ